MRQTILDCTLNSLQMTALLSKIVRQYPAPGISKSTISRLEANIQEKAAFLVLFPLPHLTDQDHTTALNYATLTSQRALHSQYLSQVHTALLQAFKKLDPEKLAVFACGGQPPNLSRVGPNGHMGDVYRCLTCVPNPPLLESTWVKLLNCPPMGWSSTPGTQVIHKLASLRKNSLAAWRQLMLDLGCASTDAHEIAKTIHQHVSSIKGIASVRTLMNELTTEPEQLAKKEAVSIKVQAIDAEGITRTCAANPKPKAKGTAVEPTCRAAYSPVWQQPTAYSVTVQLNQEWVLSQPGYKERYEFLVASLEKAYRTNTLPLLNELQRMMSETFGPHKVQPNSEGYNPAKEVRSLLKNFEGQLDALQERLTSSEAQRKARSLREKNTAEQAQALKALRDLGPLLQVLKANPDLVSKA